MIADRQIFAALVPDERANDFAYTVAALIRTARIALESSDTGGTSEAVKLGSIALTLEVAEEMQDVVINGIEAHERARGLGIWTRKEAA